MTFRIATLVSPAIVVKAGTRISIEVINADPDTAHGLVITAGPGSILMDADDDRLPRVPRLGPVVPRQPRQRRHARSHAQLHCQHPRAAPLLCPVPGHAQKGMTGSFTVS